MNIRQIEGAVRAFFYLRSPKVQRALNEVVREIRDGMWNRSERRVLVVMAGMSLSGKTTLVDSHPQLRKCWRIRTRDIHDLLNRKFDFLRDDNSVRGRAYWIRQFLTEVVRREVLHRALQQGIAIVLDSCHLTRRERVVRYRLAKRYGYHVVIIFVECPWMTLLSRAIEADNLSVARGGKRVWKDLVKQQVKVFEPPIPDPDEADQLILGKYGKMPIRFL
jgi:predicted kinase